VSRKGEKGFKWTHGEGEGGCVRIGCTLSSRGERLPRGTCRALLKGWASLWTFTQAQGVEPTNNEAERAMRRVVTWRKLSGGTQNERGAAFVERMLLSIYTVVVYHVAPSAATATQAVTLCCGCWASMIVAGHFNT
jgi:hypothetical protein